MKRISILIATIFAFTLVSFSAVAACKLNPGFEKYNKEGMRKGPSAPNKEPIPGLKIVNIGEVEAMVNQPNKFVFYDVRPKSFYDGCTLKGAKHSRFFNKGNGELTKEIVKQEIDAGKTVIFVCNAAKCYLSLNAAIQSVCEWGMPVDKIRWLRNGITKVAIEKKNLLAGPMCDKPLDIMLKGMKYIGKEGKTK